MIDKIGGIYKLRFARGVYPKSILLEACQDFSESGDYTVSDEPTLPYYTVEYIPSQDCVGDEYIPYEFINYVLQLLRGDVRG